MSHTTAALQSDAASLPHIVLLADDDNARIERHSTYMESSGLWVAIQKEPGRVLDDVLDLRPDAIVTAVQFRGQPLGRDVVHVLKSREDTRDIPVVLFGDSAAVAPATEHADVCVEPRVSPEVLLQNLSTLIRSYQLRDRAQHLSKSKRANTLLGRSDQLIARASDITASVEHLRRGCPRCGAGLTWIERGRIDGLEYDYYHWCTKGCGLHCYNRLAGSWVKLAD